jgi:Domain of unknown function (DUF1707)
MNQARAVPGEPAVRASDAERDQAAEILRTAYAEGRLARAELDERIAAAYAAKTRADLRDLTSDLPGAVPTEATAYGRPPVVDLPVLDPGHAASAHLNLCLLLCLLCAFPPAGIAYGIYWILTARRQAQPPVPERPRLPVTGAPG